MKLRLFATIIFIGLFSCQNYHRTATIEGRVIGENIDNIEYTILTDEGIYFGFKNPIPIDASGFFKIEINVPNNISFLALLASGRQGILVVESGQSYNVVFNLNEDEYFTVAGKNEKGQNYYNTLPNPGFINLSKLIDEFKKDTTALAIINNINSRKSHEMKIFKEFLDEKSITKTFYDFIKSDRDCYYASLTASIARSRFFELPPSNLKSFPLEIKSMWAQTFNEYSPTSKQYINTRWWPEYAENHIQFKEYMKDDFSVDTIMKLYKENRIHTHNLNEAQKHFSGDILKYYSAYYLFINALQGRNEKELVCLYDNFMIQFPDNTYSPYIKQLIEPIREFHAKLDKQQEPDLKYIDNYNQINTVQECLDHFKGKPIYLDIWASWCGPCLHEFKNRDVLEELLKSHGYVSIYISIDRDHNHENWIKILNEYKLSNGYHLRANESMFNDIIRLFGDGQQITIPRYVIINEFGDIVENNAARPSEIEKLEGQLVY